ncbi:rho GTPase-activating protein 36 isoform X1 [Nannospalax galili]|nr:rho GTPase-activating protein 36 isoform X1 [Nannospalax galili]XP_008824954.1 rho GTPase-activating protein 36 isoform X1 [Nannospalax galili]
MDMVSIHSLSELERLKLQETAYHELVARHFLSGFKPDRALPTDRPNTLEKWFLILRGQERAASLKTFGIRLEEVLVNELTRRKHLELTATMQVEEATGQAVGRRRGNVVQRMFGRIRRFFSRRRNEPTLPREFTRRGRRGAVSVDSLAELEDGALLLQTLQLSRVSFPIGQRLLGSKRKMSLNPIAQQIPQVVEACCKFIEKHGLSSVGIFTIEYSVQRVRELREEFDKNLDVVLDDNQNVHDVAALLKEFFREMKDSLLPDDLYMSFLLTATLKPQDQLSALQLLVYLMPPCHSDTLERLLKALHKITEYCEDSIGIDGQLVPGNRMTSTNLALVFGSALLKKGKFAKRESRKTKLGIDHYVASVNVVRAMIDNWDILFQVPPHIQKQVAKRVWKSSPEALDFIRRRNLRKIQSARIKMEEDALVSDPVETSAEAEAAVLAQSKPFDEDPEGVPDVHEILIPGENLNHDFEEGPDFEDNQNLDIAEVPYLDVIPNNEEADSDADDIPGSSEEPAVPRGTARSHDDEEGAGNPPIPEQDRPLLRVPREKEGKTGIGYFFP